MIDFIQYIFWKCTVGISFTGFQAYLKWWSLLLTLLTEYRS